MVARDPANDEILVHARIPALSFHLLRPDGHVGLCGTRLEPDAVTRYFSERLGFVAQQPVPLPAMP